MNVFRFTIIQHLTSFISISQFLNQSTTTRSFITFSSLKYWSCYNIGFLSSNSLREMCHLTLAVQLSNRSISPEAFCQMVTKILLVTVARRLLDDREKMS